MSSQPHQKRTARIHQNLKLNKKLHFPTAQSTSKYQKTSVIRTLEAQVDSFLANQHSNQQPLPIHTSIQGHPAPTTFQHLNISPQHHNALLNLPRKEGSLESSQERVPRFNLDDSMTFSTGTKKSNDKQHSFINNSDYNMPMFYPNGGVSSGGGGINNQSQKRIGGSRIMKQQFNDQLQQYSSIPMVTGSRASKSKEAAQQNNLQFKSFQRQTQVLMKMYGGGVGGGGNANISNITSNGGRKYVKSVERKVPLELGSNKKFKLNQLIITQSNSKLSNSYHINQKGSEVRKSSGGNLMNNSIVNAINIYDTAQNHGTLVVPSGGGSTESLRFKTKRSGNQSQNKYQAYTILAQQEQRASQNSSKKKVSIKNLRSRYYNMQNQPLEELKNAFNYHNSNNSLLSNNSNEKPAKNQNTSKNPLYIQQNDAYSYESIDYFHQNPFANNLNKFNTKYQTVSNLSHQTIGTIGDSSNRRLPMKGNFEFMDTTAASGVTLNTALNDKATTDTVMYLKQQELITKSQKLFEEGKQSLINKNYKEALKNFNNSLKINPGNKESKYYRAICHLDNENPKKCITDLNELIDIDPMYNKTVYIVLSIAYRRENDLNNAVKALTKGLQKFPKYVEAYQARGQIYIFMKKFDKALIDFQNVIKIQPQCGAGHIGQADSLKGLGNFKGALQSYNQAFALDINTRDQSLTKRGILLYQLKNYDQALIDFNMLLETNDKNSRAHFYKGKVLKNKSQENEAILHFEQVIKNSQMGEDQLSGNALFEIAKIRIKQKDFYEAFHNLQRAVHYGDFKSQKFLQYKMFVEGVLFIMKRKVKKGVKLLTQLVEGQITFDAKEPLNSSTPVTINQPKLNLNDKNKNQENGEQGNLKNHLIYLIYTYRSYGYIMTQQLDKALSDLNKASKLRKLESACIYNRYIAQALIKIDKKDLNGVRQILSQAEEKFPNNKDPYKFQAICIVQGCISEIVDIDNSKKKQSMMEAKLIMDRALAQNPKDSNLLFLRGLILYYMHSFFEALIDLDAAIDMDEEPNAKLYLARGRCHACLSMFQEAINDLSKAIEMDEELSDKNPMVHIYAGNLLMTTGSYDDATKAFTNADSVQKSALAFYQRSRCHIALANLDQALKDLNLVVERSPQDKIAYVDRECLQSLKNAISQSSQAPMPQQIASPSSKSGGYDLAPFEKGVVIFTKLLNTQYDIEYNTGNTTSANRMHQQIIPNVKRIKIEKMRALRRKRAKEQIYGGGKDGGMKKSKKVRGRFILEDSADEQLKQQASQIEPYSYYKENIFGQEDFYLYRGVMNFYIGEYQKAIQDFELSIKSKQEQKEKEGNGNEDNGDQQSQSSNQTDLSDVGLCSLNIHESQFNILLCYILQKDFKNALDKVCSLISDVPKKYVKNLYLIRGMIYSSLGNQAKSKADFDAYQKQDPQSYQEIFENKKTLSINPFPLGSRVCSQFPEIKVQIPSVIQQQQFGFYTRPSFSFPFVKPPNMIPNVDEIVLVQEFDLKNTSAPKPEAPWIKRCDYGIKFTDEIQVLDDSTALLTETEESMMYQQDNRQQNEGDSSAGEDDSPQRYQVDNDQSRNQKENQELNERYYLRNYVKEQRQKMPKAVSEQIIKHDDGFSFFREIEEERMLQQMDENTDEEGNPIEDEDQEGSIQDQLRQHLYGELDIQNMNDGEKNIIVDEEEINEDLQS